MKRSLKRIAVGTTQARYMATLVGDTVQHGNIDLRARQAQMLRLIADQPELSNCGPAPFQKMRMFFAGSEWVVEMEAVVDEHGGLGGSVANGTA